MSGKIPQRPKHYVTPEKAGHHAEILANRVVKMYRHLRRRFARAGIECFRLYDWDIPEVRAVVDWYAGHIVIAEYVREQTGPEWLPMMACAVGAALDVPGDRIHIKRRRTAVKDGPRYRPQKATGRRFVVRERDLQFWVNLDDHLDTGLYSDHRNTRLIMRELAKDKAFLNLFAYTGTFSCAAAAGGAGEMVTVDRNGEYLKWAEDNLALNGLQQPAYRCVRADVAEFLHRTVRSRKRFDLVFVDPPSFYRKKGREDAFDIKTEHPELLRQVLAVTRPGGYVIFSTNHQQFVPRFRNLPVRQIAEITPQTIPEDYRNKKIHRCWRIDV